MPHEVIMPALGMTQETGLIIAWLKKPGDKISTGDPLMEVETDKATMEVEAAADGWLTDIRASEGDDVPVGDVVAVISESETGAGTDGSSEASNEDGATGAEHDAGRPEGVSRSVERQDVGTGRRDRGRRDPQLSHRLVREGRGRSH